MLCHIIFLRIALSSTFCQSTFCYLSPLLFVFFLFRTQNCLVNRKVVVMQNPTLFRMWFNGWSIQVQDSEHGALCLPPLKMTTVPTPPTTPSHTQTDVGLCFWLWMFRAGYYLLSLNVVGAQGGISMRIWVGLISLCLENQQPHFKDRSQTSSQNHQYPTSTLFLWFLLQVTKTQVPPGNVYNLSLSLLRIWQPQTNLSNQ